MKFEKQSLLIQGESVGKELTRIDGRPRQSNQDDEDKIEDQIKEKINSNRQPFHGGIVVKGYARIIID